MTVNEAIESIEKNSHNIMILYFLMTTFIIMNMYLIITKYIKKF